MWIVISLLSLVAQGGGACKQIRLLLVEQIEYPLQMKGRERIQYTCLVPIYVFPEMKLCSLLISKTEL
jgi:hypothetical protein